MPVLSDIASPSQNPSPARILYSKKHPESKSRSERWVDDKMESFTRQNRAEIANNRKKLEDGAGNRQKDECKKKIT